MINKHRWHKGGRPRHTSSTPQGGTEEPPPPPVGDWLFYDQFDGGVRSPSQNGIGYTTTSNSVPAEQSIQVEADAGNVSGFALAFNYRGGGLDGLLEQHFTLGGSYNQLFIEMRVFAPANYWMGAWLPNNNKFVRLWDDTYTDSGVHIGASIITATGPLGTYNSFGQIIMEYQWDCPPADQMGTHGFGPFTTVFQQSVEVKIGMLWKIGSGLCTADGLMRCWVNEVFKKEVLNINTYLNTSNPSPNADHTLRRGHLFGHANSGFQDPTKILLRSWGVALDSPY